MINKAIYSTVLVSFLIFMPGYGQQELNHRLIEKSTAISKHHLPEVLSFQNGILSFSSQINQMIRVEVFDLKGRKISALRDGVSDGMFAKRIIPENSPKSMYFVKFKAGNNLEIFKISNYKNQTFALSSQGFYFEKPSSN